MSRPIGQRRTNRLPRGIEQNRVACGLVERKSIHRAVEYDGPDLKEIGLGTEISVWIAYRFLLQGSGSVGLRNDATVFGMDPDRRYQAFRARALPGCSPSKLASELIPDCGPREGVVVSMDGDLAGFLLRVPERVTTGVVGVGPPTRLDKVAHAFQLASRALDAAWAFDRSGIREFDEMGLLSTVLLDSDVGEALRRRYVQPLRQADSQDELLNMVRAYFACQMRVDQAAEKQRVHPNTLRNWLAVYKSLTGADLSDLSVAMEVWWALKYNALARAVDRTGSPLTVAARHGAGRNGASPGGQGAVSGQHSTAPGRAGRSRLIKIRPLDPDPASESAEGSRAAFVRGLLWGTLTSAELERGIEEYALRTDVEYRALRGIPTGSATARELAKFLGFPSNGSGCGGLMSVVNGEVVGFRATDAGEGLPGVVGVGEPRHVSRLPESFRMASRALEIANRRDLAGWREFSHFGLLPAFMAENSVGEALCQRYLGPLGENNLAVEITETLRVYLQEGMRRDRTAKRMFVHPNTVGYRISRFEKLVGVSLRYNPTVVFELLWALEYQKISRGVE